MHTSFWLTGLIYGMIVLWYAIVYIKDHVIIYDGFHGAEKSSIDHICTAQTVYHADWSSSVGPARFRRPEIYGSTRVHSHIS